MAFQMVYTSVRSGLVAGRSGFCTAARHREIKESLVARLEDFSAQYDRGIAADGTLPVVYQHRIVTIRDQRHHVLMRLGDAGNDYTGRTNHIAHCVVVEPSEIAGLSISPAEAILALSQRAFWRSHYDEAAQFFGVGDLIDLGTLPPGASLPAARWRERTGSFGNAAQLFDSGAVADAGIALAGTGEADAAEILALFAESLLLLNPDRSSGAALWSVPFTTVLQSSAERSQFRWCGIAADSGAAAQEIRAGRRVLSLGSTMSPPSSAFADIAEGRTPRVEPVAVLKTPPAGSAPAAADPGELADPIPERAGYAVPLSLEDPRRRQLKAKARKNPARTALLCAAAVVVMLAMAGGFVYWSGNKAVWEEEKRIGEMAEKGDWEKIHQEFNGPDLDAEKHPKLAAIAEAIARYKEIEKNPHQFRKTVSGTNSVDEAIEKIYKEWGNAEIDSSEPLVKQVEENRIAANDSAKTWSKGVEKVRSGSKGLRNELKKYSDPEHEPVRKHAEMLAGSLETVEAECATWDLSSLESADDVLAMVRNSILPAFSFLAEIDRKYPMDADLNELADRASKRSKGLADEDPKLEAKGGGDVKFRKEVSGVRNKLIARLENLSFEGGFAREEPPSATQTPAPPQPDPAVTAAAEAKKEKIPPKTFLVRTGSDGLIDLSRIDGAPSDLPETFEIFPLSSLVSIDAIKGQISTRRGREGSYTYYDKGKLVLRNPEELKLKKGEGAEFWEPFRGGFILRLPKDSDRADDVRYLVLDMIAGGQGSETLKPWTIKPCESFLKHGAPGEVAISDSVVAILKSITRVAGDPPKYRVTVTGDFPLESEWVVDPSAIRLLGIKKVRERLEGIAESKKLHERAVEARKSIETRYANLGTDLFPQFFESRAPNEVASKFDKKNPAGGLPPVVHGTFAEFAKGARLQRDRLSDYMEYVKSLFASLEALSEGSEQYNSGHQHIEKYIEKGRQVQPVNGLPKEAVAWYGLTQAWSTPSDSNPTPSPSDVKSMQTGRDAKQVQKKYFDDFFRVWNERFSETAVKKLIDDLNLIQSTQALPPLEQLDSKLKVLEAMKPHLENNDLTDDGEYTLELMLETPNSGSPQIIPLIRGTR